MRINFNKFPARKFFHFTRNLYNGPFNSELWLGMQNKIIELTEEKRYSEAFSYYQSLRRDIGYKIAPFVTAEICDALDLCGQEDVPLCVDGWNTLIEINFPIEGIEETIKIPDLMSQVQIQPNATTYANLFFGMIEIRDLKMQNRIFTMMIEDGIKPDSYVFNTLLGFYARVKQKDMVNILLEVMIKFDVTPDDHTAAIIKTYCSESKSINKNFHALCDKKNMIFAINEIPTLLDDLDIYLSYYDNYPKEEFDDEGRPVMPPELIKDYPDIASKIPPAKGYIQFKEEQEKAQKLKENPLPPQEPSLFDFNIDDLDDPPSDDVDDDDVDAIKESKKTAYFEEEEIKSILEQGEFGDMNKLDRLFKSFSRRIRKFTPEESKRFEEDVKKRNDDMIKHFEEQEREKEREYRSRLPPHLQFPELSYKELRKKHEEMMADPQGDMHLELSNRYYFGTKVKPAEGAEIDRGIDLEGFEESPENLKKIKFNQEELDKKIKMVFDKFLETSSRDTFVLEEPEPEEKKNIDDNKE